MELPKVKIYLLPGGRLPERQTKGAIGYDVYLRAIVHPVDRDPNNKELRRLLFDFKTMPLDPEVARHVVELPVECGGSEFGYQLDAYQDVLAGIGFVTAMEFPLFYWVAPRSGLASRYGITVTNAPGTVDPDYRGEAGVLVYNRTSKPFVLQRNMRIAQIIFQEAIIPQLHMVTAYADLPSSLRGAGGFGSTGLIDAKH